MLEEYVAVDLEMTGLKASRDRILEIGAVRCQRGEETEKFQVIVNPGIPLPEEITALTGITPAMAQGGADLRRAMENFLEFWQGLPLVGHNLYYDFSFLKQNAVNLGLSLEAWGLDTLKLSRKLLPKEESKTLEALGLRFGLFQGQKHRALEDARACGRLLELLWREFGAGREELFAPTALEYKVKKRSPITSQQKKYLKDFAGYHKIELPAELETLTRNEASRLTDRLISQYGRMPKIGRHAH